MSNRFLSSLKNLAALSLLLLPAASQSAIYSYHPDSRLYLGGGFNPFAPASGYIRCIEHEGEEAVDTQGAVSSEVSISLVTSREDLYQKIGFSASMAGSYGIFSGGGSVRMEDETAFHSDSLTFIVLFKSDYGRYVLKNPRLKQVFIRKNEQELYRTCGSEIVTEQRKSVLVYALLTVNNLTQSKRHELEASFSASASSGIWSARMDAQYKSILQTAMAASNVSVRVSAIGGRGVTDLSGLVGAGGDNPYIAYEQIPHVMKRYIEGMTANNAVATQYVTTALAAFKSDVPLRFSDFNSLHVGQLYNMYHDSLSIVNRIRGILTGPSSAQFSLNAQERNDLIVSQGIYERNLNMILAAARQCFSPSPASCALPPTESKAVLWPRPKPTAEFCEDLRMLAYTKGLVADDYLNMARRRNFVPRLQTIGVTSTITEWIACEEY